MRQLNFTVSKDSLEKIKSIYANYIVDLQKENTYFLATKNAVKIAVFNNGNVILKGNDPTNDFIIMNALGGNFNYSSIGTSIVGDTDIFGPLVVTCLYLKPSDYEYLKEINLPRVDQLTMQDIIRLAPDFSKRFINSMTILDPVKFNEMSKNDYSLNKIKARLLNMMLIKVTAKLNYDVPVLATQFCNPTNYFNYLKEEHFIFKDIYFDCDAITLNYSMVVAHILSTYAYIASLHKINKQFVSKFKRGCSKEIIEQLVNFYHSNKQDVKQVAKINLKPANRLNLKFE